MTWWLRIEVLQWTPSSWFLCPLLHPAADPPTSTFAQLISRRLRPKTPLTLTLTLPRPMIYCAALAPPEIRMFIYGHQYLIGFTLILCWWVQKSLHGCLNIKINWSPDTVKRLEVIVLGEQVASQVAAWIYYQAHTRSRSHTHSRAHAVCSRQMSSFGFPAWTSRSIWAEWKLFTKMLNQVRRHLKKGKVNHFISESTLRLLNMGAQVKHVTWRVPIKLANKT